MNQAADYLVYSCFRQGNDSGYQLPVHHAMGEDKQVWPADMLIEYDNRFALFTGILN